MQLVAYGAQDIYLTGNPQITFFKVVYRRHTNFSMEAIEQTFNGQAEAGGKATAVISRNGDLIHKMYIDVKITTPSLTAGSEATNYGTALLKSVELEIGGQRIDRLYGDWMETWAQLTQPNPAGKLALLQGNGSDFTLTGSTLYQKITGSGGVTSRNSSTSTTDLTVPLPFWFCKNVGLALPLIALQYHEVKVEIEFGETDLTPGDTPSLWVDYIYLDTDERRRFSQVSHEYLIEQVQRLVVGTSNTSAGSQIELNFNHPIKELVWIGTPEGGGRDSTPKRWVDADQTVNIQLRLNGHDRFETRNGLYFTRCQVWQYHTGFGGVNERDSIGVYSFALKPEEHQPSGTCNFSRIDDARLVINGADISTGLTVYAVNYNVLRIMSGMGGLAYSN